MTAQHRSRVSRWSELRDLLAHLDTMVLSNIAIDRLTLSGNAVVQEAAAFEVDITRVRRAVMREINKLTADQLNAELADKIKKRKK